MYPRSNPPWFLSIYFGLDIPYEALEANEATVRCSFKNLLLQTPHEFLNIKNVNYSVALLKDS